jgi:hypothetical protein
MNWVYLGAEAVICCVLFTLLIIPRLLKDPVSCVMSYPPAIRKRVASLPEYSAAFKVKGKRQIALKIIFAVIVTVLLGIIAYFSGAKTFVDAFVHVFILFFIVNVYDAVVLDILFFCRSKKMIIKGTEDMEHEYKNPKHHIVAGVKGVIIGAVVALAAACCVLIIGVCLQ